MRHRTATLAGTPAVPTARVASPALIRAVAAASGFAGLGYEMVWVKMLTVSLGHEIVAVLAVLAAFFVGLAIGAFTLNSIVRRSPDPARLYATLELAIGLWALVLTFLVPVLGGWLPGLIGEAPSALRHWSIAFGATLLLLLPATVAMGATLPAAERVYAGVAGGGRHVAQLYALNTFGAVLGTLITTFLLAPTLGFTPTIVVCATLNFACAALLIRVASAGSAAMASAALQEPRAIGAPLAGAVPLLFVGGLLGLGYEVLVVRVLSQVLENTVFTFAAVLSVYLLGTAGGAALYHRAGSPSDDVTLSRLAAGAALSSLVGILVLGKAGGLYASVAGGAGPSVLSAWSGDVIVAGLVFGLPTIAMGALFSHLAQRALPSMGLGRAVAVNTLEIGRASCRERV